MVIRPTTTEVQEHLQPRFFGLGSCAVGHPQKRNTFETDPYQVT
jgi:hypothetical protein